MGIDIKNIVMACTPDWLNSKAGDLPPAPAPKDGGPEGIAAAQPARMPLNGEATARSACRFASAADALLLAHAARKKTPSTPSDVDRGSEGDSASGPDGQSPGGVDRDSGGSRTGESYDSPGFPPESGGEFLGLRRAIAEGALLAAGRAGPQDFPGYEPKKGRPAPSKSGNGYGVENPAAPFEHPEIFKGPAADFRVVSA